MELAADLGHEGRCTVWEIAPRMPPLGNSASRSDVRLYASLLGGAPFHKKVRLVAEFDRADDALAWVANRNLPEELLSTLLFIDLEME